MALRDETPELLDYISKALRLDDCGRLWWLVASPGRRLAREAGSLDANGYRLLTVNGCRIYAHRIAFALHHRRWPDPALVLDHIDEARTNNRPENLRELGRHENMTRSRPAGRGVCYAKNESKWKAYDKRGGRQTHIGTYDTEQDAVDARLAWLSQHRHA